MTLQRRRRVEDLFAAAADLAPSERAAYLDRACGDDDALRREVEMLLEHDARAGDSFLGGIAGDAHAREPLPTPCIGPYKLLGLIGEGGFGSVYLAEQTAPVRRRVALKVVKLGMDTRQVVARFEAERQAMALLEHPGIARVLDAGATEHGRPYVVMEYVPGVPITDYCESEQLDTDARLALFLLVCDAVQHAHQRGIIHRDLKPSNILVEVIDGAAVPKIIDFGIAKAIGGTLTDRTLMTEQGQLVGTPEYMSPEQAEMSPLGVDTRTDIYSLGVVLYELLVGALPWEPRTLRGGSIADIQRRIREEQPVRPSTRLRSAASLASEAVRRRATATQRGRRLRGDLDWITLKAMEKERSRRYASASEFAADIRRHLAHEPVQAGPPSAAYRAWKFARRHRTGVIAGGVAVTALLAALVGISWGLVHTRAARDAALESQRAAEAAGALASQREAEAEHLRERESDLRAAAEAESRRARAVTSFLVDTLALGDPSVAGRPDIPMRDVLDLAARRVGRALADMPEEQAAVRATIGRAYLWMGDPALAILHLSRAVELLDARGADPADVYSILLSQWRAMEAGGDAQTGSVGMRLWNTQVQLLTRADAELGAVCAAIQQRTATDAPDPAAVAQVRRRAESLDPEDSTRRLLAEFLALCGGVELRYGS
ncbi:MAG TPA: serine/threonine-protein kinase, partial [Candidatus Tectomicrobia bacterium]|nr:serine/threonine-protein kinase [Candidatus Tectomicrobia bacterium]